MKPSKKNNKAIGHLKTMVQSKTMAQSSAMNVHTVTNQAGLHKKNKHHGRYDFEALMVALPELKPCVINNPRGEKSINFSDPLAVKLLNKALLAHHYKVTEWDIPKGYLCPPIPGRADYIHRAAELLSNESKSIKHTLVRALDIGVGANCIYPIIGVCDYGWQYVASDIDEVSVENANKIAANNERLQRHIECRLQHNGRHFFEGVIKAGEFYDITTCNPPFHKSLQEAEQGSQRKINNLNANKAKKGTLKNTLNRAAEPSKTSAPTLNFGGQKAELWCDGGESEFIKNMALESKQFGNQVLWFTTLISKKENVKWMQKTLEKIGAVEMKIVEMSQGQKISRFVAWTFKTAPQRQKWLKLKS
ncbi:23S rRNA (adenine(1618)-N(6))-methyltransferase RlmF [Vibrio genomosp. F10]|uniref:23S rRNA (adenine(1618)-N(6))-methyltransferase RlmF n=1 Tax=Vibrio genomosp. F10 TaxID=723171 RepID=UPI00030163D3|nr:23S rRNA (adenine(1618)-N(6))-methyltransferase [Vibrio genomosp. F10 str. 9ZB36]